ncbi:hypothetical protein K227x_13450 [Rubripirellula lacrimiformis]|uniref:Uncharacterized protein n=2 Tax=Rubripirellula lacrimiformis TaxID=1930273 RepID=A0A517N745_9BACT|nr:hypothetical protein K227x_13450 [Rubripirellula lacrimiformis]
MLENRQMMAGDVTVEFVADGNFGFDVVITGDAEDNSIEVAEVGNRLEVRGLNQTGINGGTAPATIELVRLDRTTLDDIMIEMGDGSDSVVMRDIQIGSSQLPVLRSSQFLNPDQTKDLHVNLGRGDNRFEATDVFVRDHFTLDSTVSWAGDNDMTLNDVEVGQDLRVYTSRGNDDLQINGGSVGDDLYVSTARGIDNIGMFNVDVGDNINIDTGSDNDVVNLSNVTADDVVVVGNSGDDQLSLINVAAADDVFVDGGTGDDTIMATDVTSRDMWLYGSRGGDRIIVSGTINNFLRVEGGRGNDIVTLRNIWLASGRIAGGSGTDVISISIDGDPALEQRLEADARQRSFESVR